MGSGRERRSTERFASSARRYLLSFSLPLSPRLSPAIIINKLCLDDTYARARARRAGLRNLPRPLLPSYSPPSSLPFTLSSPSSRLDSISVKHTRIPPRVREQYPLIRERRNVLSRRMGRKEGRRWRGRRASQRTSSHNLPPCSFLLGSPPPPSLRRCFKDLMPVVVITSRYTTHGTEEVRSRLFAYRSLYVRNEKVRRRRRYLVAVTLDKTGQVAMAPPRVTLVLS